MLRDLKIPSQTLEAHLYCTQSAAVGMETSTTDETNTVVPAHYRTQAIFTMSNLSAACKPVLSSQFPPRHRKKKNNFARKQHCHGAISHAIALQGELTGDLTTALTSSHHILLF